MTLPSNGFVNCARFVTAPCLEVTLIGANCSRYPMTEFTSAKFSPSIHGMGEFTIRFCESDIPAEFQTCCTGVEVTLEWTEAKITKQKIYSGRFNSASGFVNSQEDIIEWHGRNLLDVLNSTYIAYRSGEPGAFKDNIPAATAVYEYLVENLVTPLATRGDGSACALTMPGNVVVNPPSATIVASSQNWVGSRSFDALLDVTSKLGLNNDFAVVAEYNADCEIEFNFVQSFDNTDVLLTECLENVKVTRVNSSCDRFNVVHMLGAGEGAARAVVTVCDETIQNGSCRKEFRLSRNQEDNLDSLRIEGEEFLASQNGRDTLQFRTDWSCSYLPFRDVMLGDFVSLEYNGQTRTYQITEMPFMLASSRDQGIQLIEVSAVFKEDIQVA